ncbi:unnamed protein product [Caretta caretta]
MALNLIILDGLSQKTEEDQALSKLVVWAGKEALILDDNNGLVGASQESGSVIPAESRPCVDCHAFEFMQRALQDLKKTAYNLDTRTETLLLRAEKRGLCDCFPAMH